MQEKVSLLRGGAALDFGVVVPGPRGSSGQGWAGPGGKASGLRCRNAEGLPAWTALSWQSGQGGVGSDCPRAAPRAAKLVLPNTLTPSSLCTVESPRGLGRSPCLGDSGLRAGGWSAPPAGSRPPGTPGLTSRPDSAVSSSGPGIPFGGGIADGKMSFMGEPPAFLPVHKGSWLAAAADPASTPLLIS